MKGTHAETQEPQAPAHLVIAGVTWTITRLSTDAMFQEEHADLLGCCRWKRCEVVMREGMPPSRTASILLHEIVHAVINNAGADVDEPVVRAVSNGLFEVLRHNPLLRAYFDAVM